MVAICGPRLPRHGTRSIRHHYGDKPHNGVRRRGVDDADASDCTQNVRFFASAHEKQQVRGDRWSAGIIGLGCPILMSGSAIDSPAPGSTVGLLLAAGRGRRFDPTAQLSKLLAPIDGEPLIRASARNLRAATDRLIVVVRDDASAVPIGRALESLDCMQWAYPATEASGIGDSIHHGIAALPADAARVVIALADMPRVRAATIRQLIGAARAPDSIVAPIWHGQRGHPVVFGRAHFAALAACAGDRGAAALLRDRPLQLLTVDDPGVLLDVDTPADLPTPLSK